MAYAEKRANGWRARYRLPDGTLGSEPGFDTKRAAVDWGKAQEVDIDRNVFVDRRRGDITFFRWAEEWLQSVDVEPNSIDVYRRRLRAQIYPKWANKTLAEIEDQTLVVQKWAKQVRADQAPNYSRDILSLFRMLMDDAVADRRIAVNPLPKTNRRRGRYVRKEKAEKTFGTPRQVLELAENARIVWGFAGYVFILTKAYTGMRLGEMYGLRREYCYPNWPLSDPDRKQRAKMAKRYGDLPLLRVEQQHLFERLEEGEKGVPVLRAPKYASKRTLILPQFLAELLQELLESHEEPWVFRAMGGGPLLLTDFNTYYWRPIVDGAEERVGRYARPAILPVDGLDDLVPHGLRHGHKAWLDEDGHSTAAVEERMGHVLQGIIGTYSHVTIDMEKRIAKSLQKRWKDSLKPPKQA